MTNTTKFIGTPTQGKQGNIDLNTIPQVADCDTGFDFLTEYNVLVAPPIMSDKIAGTSLFAATSTVETSENAAQAARIVMISPLAFSYDNWPEGSKIPQVGDVVWFSRYSGGQITGYDGKSYRMIKDKDIMGKLKE